MGLLLRRLSIEKHFWLEFWFQQLKFAFEMMESNTIVNE